MKPLNYSGVVNDKRRKPKNLPCRVCGCPDEEHSNDYKKPTMDCITFMRNKHDQLALKTELLVSGLDNELRACSIRELSVRKIRELVTNFHKA